MDKWFRFKLHSQQSSLAGGFSGEKESDLVCVCVARNWKCAFVTSNQMFLQVCD